MIRYVDEIEALFDLYENDHLTEKEIFHRSIDLAKKHKLDRDYLFDLNDVIFNRGYSFQFDVPPLDHKKFDNNEYWNIASNVGKSLDKTKELISYLKDVCDFRLSFASLHMLKVKYLISIRLLPSDNDFINAHSQFNLRDLLFTAREKNDSAFESIINILDEVGISYASLGYMRFRLDVEYLLWSIEQTDANYGYIKVNTLKIALNMAPKEYFEHDGKLYYNYKFSKSTRDYLKLINEDKIKEVKEEWGEGGYSTDGTGYLLLYNLL